MKTYALSLPSADVFQILDALDSRAEAWEYTARLLSGETDPDEEPRIAEECHNSDEAAAIADSFRKIGETIRAQIGRQ